MLFSTTCVELDMRHKKSWKETNRTVLFLRRPTPRKKDSQRILRTRERRAEIFWREDENDAKRSSPSSIPAFGCTV
jgi:hypothetical protein